MGLCASSPPSPGSPDSWRTAGGATYVSATSAASFRTALSAPRSPRTPARSLAPAFDAAVIGDVIVPQSSTRDALRALRSLVAALDAPNSRPQSAASSGGVDGLASHPLRSPPRSPAGEAPSVAGASPSSFSFADVPLHDSPAAPPAPPPRRRSALGELTSNALAAAASVFGGGGKRAPAPASGAPAASVGAASVAAALE